MIKVFCTGNGTRAVCDQWLTRGTVGAECEFDFDSTWDDLRKTAVFIAGDTQRDVVLTENQCVVPWEVLTQEGVKLTVGVYGVDAGGTVVVPTIYADVGTIRPGAEPGGDPSAEPTLPVWAQICSEIGELRDLETAEKNNLVAAINEAAQSGGGGGGGTTDHNQLTNRNAANQHPISAITGLQSQLDGKQPAGDYALHAEVQSVRSEMDGKQDALITSGASVGQIARIAAADASGKPTAWEAVSMPQGSGGGSSFELINHVTVGNSDVVFVDVNRDSNNKSFSLKEMIVIAKILPNSGSFGGWIRLYPNIVSAAGCEFGSGITNANECSYQTLHAKVIEGTYIPLSHAGSINSSNQKEALALAAGSGKMMTQTAAINAMQSITSVRMTGYQASIGVGSEIWLYGVRV